MVELLLHSFTRNINKLFELIFVWSMFLAIENRNAFYAIGGYILYCMFDICSKKYKAEHRPTGKVTLADDFDRSRIHIEKCH